MQAQRTADFWTGMWRAAGEAQLSMIARMQEQLGRAEEPQAGEVSPEHAGEDATELAAAHLSRAVGQARRKAAG